MMLKSVFQLAAALAIYVSAVISPGALAQTVDASSTDGVVATVNGRPIQQISLDNVTRQISADGQQADPRQILDELINLEVLTQAAEELELEKDPEIAATLKLQYTQTLANAYLASKSAQMTFTDEYLRSLYESQSASADRAEYKASHILLETQEEAIAVLAELAEGQSFTDAAAEYSLDPSGESGGDLGWFVSASMAPQFAEAVAGMEVGDIYEAPVETEFGYHIINLIDKREAALPDFDSVKSRLTNLAVRQALAEHVEELKAAADIDISAQ